MCKNKMFLYFKLKYIVSALCSYIIISGAVVPDYCLQPLNTSDCGLKPTPVMSYWKPGSRCEVDTWRGCPTVNLFDNEYECSLTCIFQMKTEIESSENKCTDTFNGAKCDKNIHKPVYVFMNGSCIKQVWQGCPTLNKFDGKEQCLEACAENIWENRLTSMEVQQLKHFVTILDDITEVSENITQSSTESSNSDYNSTEVTEEPDDLTNEIVETTVDDIDNSESTVTIDEVSYTTPEDEQTTNTDEHITTEDVATTEHGEITTEVIDPEEIDDVITSRKRAKLHK